MYALLAELLLSAQIHGNRTARYSKTYERRPMSIAKSNDLEVSRLLRSLVLYAP